MYYIFCSDWTTFLKFCYSGCTIHLHDVLPSRAVRWLKSSMQLMTKIVVSRRFCLVSFLLSEFPKLSIAHGCYNKPLSQHFAVGSLDWSCNWFKCHRKIERWMMIPALAFTCVHGASFWSFVGNWNTPVGFLFFPPWVVKPRVHRLKTSE